MVDRQIIHWAFLDRDVEVNMLGDKVAYQWRCTHIDPKEHEIECLWIWHKCDMHLDPNSEDLNKRTWLSIGWQPTGVALHDLIQVEPLHIEASVYWPACCGMHGFIRNGIWIGV